MKRKAIWLAAIVIALVSCSKDNSEPANSIVGKWRQTEVFSSPGGPGQWQPYNNGLILTIHSDSTYTSTQQTSELHYFSTPGRIWKYPTDSTVTFRNGLGDFRIRPQLTDHGKTMILWVFSCIEGCGDKFVRIP